MSVNNSNCSSSLASRTELVGFLHLRCVEVTRIDLLLGNVFLKEACLLESNLDSNFTE